MVSSSASLTPNTHLIPDMLLKSVLSSVYENSDLHILNVPQNPEYSNWEKLETGSTWGLQEEVEGRQSEIDDLFILLYFL